LSAGYGAPDLRVLGVIGYSFGITDTDPNAPGRRYEFKRDLEPKSGDADNDGIPDDLDLCPTVPEDHQPPDTSDGCPAASDRDHDGIPDESDKCPDQPEDKDGIDDLDGCPEDDFDQDGIPDATDACPREPGQPSPDPKKNGCPQFIRHIEGSTEIQILKKVEFATGSAQLLPSSYPILDEVVKLLKTNADIQRIAVEGHTNSRGAKDMNMRLSQARAESVMRYLAGKGITAARLEAHGYGPEKPIDTNDTDEGRQRNRRVEFHIKSQ
jgi:OmpA-OmpF porin, OOP family